VPDTTQGAKRASTITALHGPLDAAAKALEPGIEKVAIYADLPADSWTHAARQLPNGRWTSKLGDFEDIEHDTPEGLAGNVYLSLAYIMKR
jgi:hypothetical protein